MSWKEFPDLYRKGQIIYLKTRDGCRLRTACWPAESQSKAIVVLVNGHREYMEKYSEFISEFLTRNVGVYTLDNRGQGLSDRLLNNRMKSYAKNFDYFSSDLNEFITQIVQKDPRTAELPLYLVGHSMGGHICLRYLHDHPNSIDKAVLLSPMLGMKLGSKLMDLIGKSLISALCSVGLDKAFVPGQGTRKQSPVHQSLITHDTARYEEDAKIIERWPDLYVGGATFGWVYAALRSIEKITQPNYMDPINLPLLAVLAGDENLVDNQATQNLFSDRDNVTLFTLKGARHEIYREKDHYRDILWQKLDDFLSLKQR